MRATFKLICCALALSACSKDEAPPAPVAPSAAPAAASAAPAAPVAAAPSASAAPALAGKKPLGERLQCKKLFSDDTLAKVAPGYDARQMTTCAECGPECNLTMAGKPFEGAQVKYVCNEKFDKALVDKTVAAVKPTLKKTSVPPFGRGGIQGDRDNGLFAVVVAFDDDSDCRVTVEWMHGKKDAALGLAKAALAQIKQADLE